MADLCTHGGQSRKGPLGRLHGARALLSRLLDWGAACRGRDGEGADRGAEDRRRVREPRMESVSRTHGFPGEVEGY